MHRISWLLCSLVVGAVVLGLACGATGENEDGAAAGILIGQRTAPRSDSVPFPMLEARYAPSSENNPWESAKLVGDRDPQTYWHVQHPKVDGQQDVLTLQLPVTIELSQLAIRARPGLAVQLWRGNQAVLEGSNDGQQWKRIGSLAMPSPLVDTWVYFAPNRPQKYSWFRVAFLDPGFLALADLQLFVTSGTLPPDLAKLAGDIAVEGAEALVGQRVGSIPRSVGALGTFDLRGAQFTSSSYNQTTEQPDRVADGDQVTYWHIKMPPSGEVHTLTIDAQQQLTVYQVAVRARPGLAVQLWRGPNASIEGSDDGQTWRPLAKLDIGTTPDDSWIYFSTQSPWRHRWFRLTIQDSNFRALADVQLRVPRASIDPSQLVENVGTVIGTANEREAPIAALHPRVSASSQNAPAQGPGAVVDGDLQTYWHTQYPRKANVEESLTFEFDSPVQVRRMFIAGRDGPANQLWSGETARFERSSDGRTWQLVANLELPRSVRAEAVWVSFAFPTGQDAKYYRLVINDPEFLSIAEVRFR